MSKFEIVTQRLVLRDFTLDDYPAMRAIDSIPQVYTYEGEVPSDAKIMELIQKAAAQASEDHCTSYRLAVTLKPGDELIGRVKLALNFDAIKEWEVGWLVRPDQWGNGYATEAARAIIDHAFRLFSAHRVVAYCHAGNTASRRVMEKAGMTREGRLRQVRWLNGNWEDEYVYSILEDEWAIRSH